MLLNRIIMLVLIVASGVFASFYGGNVSYALLYMMILIPIVSSLYTFYVYIRFRLYQEIDQRKVVKGDLTPYILTLANEDYITFCSIKVNFLQDKSTIISADSNYDYCLLPGDSKKMETHLRCNYRGEFSVGVNSVDIMDFLYLFRITYPIRSKLKVTVLPRVVTINQLKFAPSQKDVKNLPYINNVNNDILDVDTRKYQHGDSKKQIHWKVLAKRKELLSRKFSSMPKSETVLYMNLMAVNQDSMANMITEDRIIECVLSIANFYLTNNTYVKIFYEQDGLQEFSIRSRADFDIFYQICVGLRFRSKMPIDEVFMESQRYLHNNYFGFILTHQLTREFYSSILEVVKRGNEVAVLLAKDKLDQEEDGMVLSLREAGIPTKQVMREDDTLEVLSSW